MKILSVIGTAQSCFHAKTVGMKILSAIGTARSLGFYEGDGVRAMGDASKTPTPKKNTFAARREI
jgi:hypothetical protein